MNDTTEEILSGLPHDGKRSIVKIRWAETRSQAVALKAGYDSTGSRRCDIFAGDYQRPYKIVAHFLEEC